MSASDDLRKALLDLRAQIARIEAMGPDGDGVLKPADALIVALKADVEQMEQVLARMKANDP